MTLVCRRWVDCWFTTCVGHGLTDVTEARRPQETRYAQHAGRGMVRHVDADVETVIQTWQGHVAVML